MSADDIGSLLCTLNEITPLYLKQIYISCLLKAISASAPVTIENKACSFYEGYENVFEDLSFIDLFKMTFMTLTLPTVCGWL